MITFDTETVGLTGPIMLLQYAKDDGPVRIHNVFNSTVDSTIRIIEDIVDDYVCAFNLTFDWFHLCKDYNILTALRTVHGGDHVPTKSSYRDMELREPTEYCLRPRDAVDIMLIARKTELQAIMKRKPIIIKNVHLSIALALKNKLEATFKFPDMIKATWELWDGGNDMPVRTGFTHIRAKFSGSMGLDAVSNFILGTGKSSFIPEQLYVKDDSKHLYDPVSGIWLPKFDANRNYWGSSRGLEYAETDVIRTRQLYNYFKSKGDINSPDVDSLLACSVGSNRWRGFELDSSKVREYLSKDEQEVQQFIMEYGYGCDAHARIKRELYNLGMPTNSTNDDSLKRLSESEEGSVRVRNYCKRIRRVRSAKKRADILKKLSTVNRYRPDFVVVGTRTGRMSGTGGINPHGITESIRDCFLFDQGGDFDSFEIFIQDALYGDDQFHADIIEGRKIYGSIGSIFTGMTYDEVMDKFYKPSKIGFLALTYGAQDDRLAKAYGIQKADAAKSLRELKQKYHKMVEYWEQTHKKFTFLTQPKQFGEILWHNCATYQENLFGFRRYFNVEIETARTLYEVAKDLEFFKKFTAPCYRREDRSQTAGGAAQSALYAAAFNIQGQVHRQAVNHTIQSTGAYITKAVQWAVQELQPIGVHPYIIQTYQVHDELETVGVCARDAIHKKIREFREQIPLLSMTWKDIKTWKDLK
jgi:hypothetical protein